MLDPGWKQFLSRFYQSFYQSHKPSQLRAPGTGNFIIKENIENVFFPLVVPIVER